MLLLASGASAQEGAGTDLKSLVRQAAQDVCTSGIDTAPASGAKLVASAPLAAPNARGEVRGWMLPSGVLLRVSQLRAAQQGALTYVDAYRPKGAGNLVPLFRGVAGGGCRFVGGQDVLYSADAGDSPFALQQVGPDFSAMRAPSPLNPPVPAGTADPACLKVAVLDNGVNYTLPEIAPRLARAADGSLVGGDYWENDNRPYDYGYPSGSLDPRVSPFTPRHHGTSVASVLLAVAPSQACIAPYRYQPEGRGGEASDVGRIIDDMAAGGVRIVNLSSGRDRPWPEFEQAIAAHPDMLFVLAAGNDGRDLSTSPSYPAAYRADNVIVVAGSTARGDLWEHSNRGPVDLAVTAVDIPAIVENGSREVVSGTSYSAPRVAGLAARLLANSPKLTAADLKRAILALATASGVLADGVPVLPDSQL